MKNTFKCLIEEINFMMQPDWMSEMNNKLMIRNQLCKLKEIPYKQGKGHSMLNKIMQFKTKRFKDY